MFSFKVTPDGGESFDVKVTSRDIAKWEKTTKGASLAGLQSDMKASDLYRVIFHALVRQGRWSGTLAEFEESHDFEDVDEDDVDPTQLAASSGEISP